MMEWALSRRGAWKHYNYFRDFDSAIGRYAQNDPIGLKGGLNTYLYAGANPLRLIDPLGLVSWSGLSFTMGSGPAVSENYDLVSECKCGRQVRARVNATGLGIGRGYSWAGSWVTLRDGAQCPDAGSLEGNYTKFGAGFAGGIGIGFNTIQLGSAGSPSSFDTQIGLDFSGGATFGQASVVWSFSTPCECKS